MHFFPSLALTALCLALALPHTAAAAEDKETEHRQILRISREALRDGPIFTAAKLHEAIAQNSNSLHIISLQNREDYARGHIPGAVRVPLTPQGAVADLPALLASLPKDKTIVVTCANGQLSCHVSLLLRQLGYNARSLLLGMSAWNNAYAGAGMYQAKKLPVNSAATPLPLGPVTDSSPSGMDDAALIMKRTAEYYAQKRPISISAQEAMSMRDNAVLLSLQSPEDYAYSHIEGTANLPATVFTSGAEDLLRLPRDKKIIVTCYIGHYSNTGALLLNQLGYEAYSLEWGLTGWNPEGLKRQPSWMANSTALPVESNQ